MTPVESTLRDLWDRRSSWLPGPLSRESRGGPGRRGAFSDVRTSELLRRIQSHDYSNHSDRDLKSTLHDLGRRSRAGSRDKVVSEVFAVVNETISRRLGAWRLFDPDFDKGALTRYQDVADQVLASGPYKSDVDFYTDPDYLGSDAFAESVTPALRRAGLDDAEQLIVRTMVLVAEKGDVDYWSNILLPAEFYRAISAKDIDGALRFRASEEQLAAGLLLCRRVVVEMDAGEGKTIAAAFPSVLWAISGRSVHIITANDYLAARDANWLGLVYEPLGLTVSAILGHMAYEERANAYKQQIAYGTLREFGFDFLRDNLKIPPDRGVQGDLDVAIVDEADYALIDQARTPLIISGEPAGSRRGFERTRRAVSKLVALQAERIDAIETRVSQTEMTQQAKEILLAKLLLAGPDSNFLKARFAASPGVYNKVLAAIDADEFVDTDDRLAHELFYVVDPRHKSVTLTDRGQAFIEKELGPVFEVSTLEQEIATIEHDAGLSLAVQRALGDRLRRRISRQNNRMSQIYQMLRAHVLLVRDVDYVVNDEGIVLVDGLTGRTLPENRYQQGLHSAIEAKESVNVHPESDTLAQISVQGFINQYSQLSGMTGTALDSRDEFGREYGLSVETVPPTQPKLRADFGTRLYLRRRDKLEAVLDEVRSCRRVGRPVLVGTLTIEQSAQISGLLSKNGIDHSLLNAVNDVSEAEIVKNAGAFGVVTVATNMAGRGTDIVLASDLDERIVGGYVALVRDLLRAGASRVELACAQREEADVLRDALSRLDDWVVTGRDGVAVRPYHTVLTVSSGDSPLRSPENSANESRDLEGGAGTAPETVRLEFGLGLYVIGTEMNQSRRVDRQLRGRSGRQGAFGASRFIVALEDQLLAVRGDDLSRVRLRPLQDSSGRTYYESHRLDRRLEALQGLVERENEVQRTLLHEYTRVPETQTLFYYAARRQVVKADALQALSPGYVADWAQRLVDRHFPVTPLESYESRFDRMSEELWQDCEIDCYDLDGTGLDRLAHEIGRLVETRLAKKRAEIGDSAFASLEKLLLLQSSDELWKEHMAELYEMMLAIPLGQYSHKAAVAEYAIRSYDAYGRLKNLAMDVFVSRLLTFRVQEFAEEREPEVTLIEDVSRILV